MKITTIYFFLLIFIVLGCSPSGTYLFIEPDLFSSDKEIMIYGRVVDMETNEPLVGAEIYSNDGKLRSFVDINGFYLIRNLPQGKYNIHCSFVGYKEITLSNIKFTQYKCYILDFRLKSYPIFN